MTARSVTSPPVTPSVLRHADRAATPWANGGGLTREVARSGPTGTAPGFDWRVSVAEVDRPGPFSRLPEVDRVILLVRGTGLVLSVDGRERLLDPLTPFAFSGDSTTTCELHNGPTWDLNVMTARDRVAATVEVIELTGRRELRQGAGEEVLVVATGGGATAVNTAGGPVELADLDAVAGPAILDGRGAVVVVHLVTTEAAGR